MLKLVPFSSSWVTHETLDVHAIYRRPVRNPDTGDIQRDEYGFVMWDLTTPLPVRQHARWVAKGFEYVTLATNTDIVDVSTAEGLDPLFDSEQYMGQHPRTRAPWFADQYLQDIREAHTVRRDSLLQRIAKLGPDAAEEFEQQKDPGYALPDNLRSVTDVRTVTIDDEPTPKKRGRPRKRQEEAVPA